MEHIKIISARNIITEDLREIPFKIGVLDSYALYLVESTAYQGRKWNHDDFEVNERVVIFEDIVYVFIMDENVPEARWFLLGDLEASSLRLEYVSPVYDIDLSRIILGLSYPDEKYDFLAQELYNGWRNGMIRGGYSIKSCTYCLERVGSRKCITCRQMGRSSPNVICWNCPPNCVQCQREKMAIVCDFLWEPILKRHRARQIIKKEIHAMIFAQKYSPPTLPVDIQRIIAEMLTWRS